MSDRTAPTAVEQEVRAVFARILDAPRPHLDVASMTDAEIDERIAAIEATRTPTLAEDSVRLAAKFGLDDKTGAAIIAEFLTGVHNKVAVILLAAYPGMRANVLAGGAR